MNRFAPQSRMPRRNIYCLLAAALAATGLALGLMTGSGSLASTTAAQGTGHESVQAEGVEFTPAAAQALRAAYAAHPHLDPVQAGQIAAGAGGVTRPGVILDAWGSGESSGPCGTAVLQGDSYGNWNFSLSFNTEVVGTASIGGVTVSTNAVAGADSKGFGVRGGSMYHDALRDGPLSSIGWGAPQPP